MLVQASATGLCASFMPRRALLSIHGLSILRLFSRMSWPAIARSHGVTLFYQTRSKFFIGKLTQASDRRRSFDRSASRHGWNNRLGNTHASDRFRRSHRRGSELKAKTSQMVDQHRRDR